LRLRLFTIKTEIEQEKTTDKQQAAITYILFLDKEMPEQYILINQGKPPAEPERLPEFDNSWNIRKPPTVNCSKFNKEGGFQ